MVIQSVQPFCVSFPICLMDHLQRKIRTETCRRSPPASIFRTLSFWPSSSPGGERQCYGTPLARSETSSFRFVSWILNRLGEGVMGGRGGAVFGAVGLDNLVFISSILSDNTESIVLYVSCNGGEYVCVFLFYFLRSGGAIRRGLCRLPISGL